MNALPLGNFCYPPYGVWQKFALRKEIDLPSTCCTSGRKDPPHTAAGAFKARLNQIRLGLRHRRANASDGVRVDAPGDAGEGHLEREGVSPQSKTHRVLCFSEGTALKVGLKGNNEELPSAQVK